jgi:hypothetical protein
MSLLYPSGDLNEFAEALYRLERDVAHLRADGRPTDEMLVRAPILNHWVAAIAPAPCLVGSVSGHPRLGSRPLIHTSELYALDPIAGWARTWSRWYRLGIPKGGFGGGNA